MDVASPLFVRMERWAACIFRETLTIDDRMRIVSTSLSEHAMISRHVSQRKTLEQFVCPALQSTPTREREWTGA